MVTATAMLDLDRAREVSSRVVDPETGEAFLEYVERADDVPLVFASVTGDTTINAYWGPVSGRRWRPTWQAGFWPLALRIDHILVSPQLCVEAVEVGPSIGSDHRPVIARLRLPR